MKKMQTFDDVLALWSSPKALRDDLGVTYVNAQAILARRVIGVDHWPKLIRLLADKGYSVSADDLLAMRELARNQPQSPEPERVAS